MSHPIPSQLYGSGYVSSPPGPKLQCYPSTPSGQTRTDSGSPPRQSNEQDKSTEKVRSGIGYNTSGPLSNSVSTTKGTIRSVVDKFQQDHKSSREVLYLQQQLYQEERCEQVSTLIVPNDHFFKMCPRQCMMHGDMFNMYKSPTTLYYVVRSEIITILCI